MIGRLVTLSDEGEGWLTGYTRVTGVVESVVPAGTPVPQNEEDIGNINIRAWASCVLAEDTCT
jgi:hypothetical protein